MNRIHVVRALRSAIILSLIILSAIAPLPAYAIANPDSPTTIGTVECYNSIYETGDLGVLLDFHTNYAVLPTETITQAYRVSFNDTDGTTRLKSVVPYALLNKGYHEGLAWIYFTAAEVTAASISSVNIALYRVEVYGNAALGWVPGPAPATFDTIDTWNTTGDSKVLLALDVVTYATALGTTWSLGMVQTTSVGTKLTSYGASYFENVIANARVLAPAAFYNDTTSPIRTGPNYTTKFGAIMTNGTGTCTGSPITLVSGANVVVATGTGTFTLVLEQGTVGTATTIAGGGGGTVTGSPVVLKAGTNTITVSVAGNIAVTVQLQNTQTKITSTSVTGTGFDLSVLATMFGMSRDAFSGFVWLAISIIICAVSYDRVGGKAVLLVFEICTIGGAVLGLMPLLVAVLMFIGFGALAAYVFFFRGAIV